MTINQKRANKEVLVILKKFNLEKEIPNEVVKNIEENQDNDWNFVYDDSLELEEQNMLRETAILFSTLYLMYICKDNNEREELKQIYKANEEHFNETNDFETVIKNAQKIKDNNETETIKSELPVSVENSLFDRIKKWLKAIFKK